MPTSSSPGPGWVAYVGPFLFPWGQPGSRRVYGMARSLAQLGYDVVVGSGGDQPPRLIRLDDVDEGPGSIFHIGLGELPSAADSPLERAVRVLVRWGRDTVRWLDAQPSRPRYVLVYGAGAQYLLHLRAWCRRNRVPLVADVVEWPDPSHLRYGMLGPANVSAKAALAYHLPRCDGIVAVSSYLAEHFGRRGLPVACVPPTLDVRGLDVRPRVTEPDPAAALNLLYCGTPGRKDALADIIRAVALADPGGHRIRLRIAGPTARQVYDLLAGAPPPPNVELLGALPQQDVPGVLRRADFTVLLRAPVRFANAGFPTKFGESLANGTPVIANLTSDLGRYLRDGVEGLVCPDNSVASLARTLRRALLLRGGGRLAMSHAARRQGLASFDFRAHTAAVGRLLATVGGPQVGQARQHS